MADLPKHIIKRASGSELSITLRIGKEGLGENIVSELNSQLSSNNLVKVKVNKYIYDKQGKADCWAELSKLTKSKLVVAKGNVAVFYRT